MNAFTHDVTPRAWTPSPTQAPTCQQPVMQHRQPSHGHTTARAFSIIRSKLIRPGRTINSGTIKCAKAHQRAKRWLVAHVRTRMHTHTRTLSLSHTHTHTRISFSFSFSFSFSYSLHSSSLINQATVHPNWITGNHACTLFLFLFLILSFESQLRLCC
jgi:hypothetical protein